MVDLNIPSTFKHLDPKDVYGSTGLLSEQVKQVLNDFKSINPPNDYRNIKNIVISGMGGSAYGGHVAKSLLKQDLEVPIYINNDYTLPSFVNTDSLVILISYSGATEETLASARQALEKKAKISGITASGDLEEFLKQNSSFYYIFDPKNNPSGQPRLGTGYIVLGTLMIFKKLNLIDLSEDVIVNATENLLKNKNKISENAKDLAQKTYGKIPLIFASEFLEGNAHILRNQVNETAKCFSEFGIIPEINHHLMEGLKNPQDRKLISLFINSTLYSERNEKRLSLTKDVVTQNNIEIIEYLPNGNDQLSHVLDVLSFGGFYSFYLAILYNQDPSLIPWVDYFKENLKK